MTYLAVPIFGDSIEHLRQDIALAIERGADLIELRLDLMPDLTDDEIRSLRADALRDVLVILTIRSEAEGGDWRGSDQERITQWVHLAPYVDFIDVEFDAWQQSEAVRHALRHALGQADRISPEDREQIIAQNQRHIIFSKHDLSDRPSVLQSDFLQMMYTEECRVPKMAWRARTIRDNFEALELMRHASASQTVGPAPQSTEHPIDPKPAIVICMGADGLLSRVLAKKFGAFATFASLGEGRATAWGQPTITTLRELYRWDTIDRQTEVYGVIGDPIAHSFSPRIHNAAFEEIGTNAVYLPLRVNPSYESFKAFMVEVQTQHWMDFRGFSVTTPHKENAIKLIQNTHGTLDPLSIRIGAVNTILMKPDGSLHGFNTDCSAAIEAITMGLRRSARELAGLEVSILGAGGVARAIVAGLTERGARVTIYNRTQERSKLLAEHFSCDSAIWERRSEGQPDLIINCTSVGMDPDIESTPFRAENLRQNQAVFDTIYNPLKTKLLKQATYRGCTIINGLTMFALQAQAQFELWTGKKLPMQFFWEAATGKQS